LLLTAGRDPNVQGNLHFDPPQGVMGQVKHLPMVPSPNAEGPGRRNPSVVDHRYGRLLNDLRAISTACFLPGVIEPPGRIMQPIKPQPLAAEVAAATTIVPANPTGSSRICHL
jgi:hypothetical protein